MRRMRPIRKSSFLVIELLVALFLIVTCLFPLLKPNIAFYMLERKRIEACKHYSEDRVILCEVKEALFEGKYRFEQLKKGVEGPNFSITCLRKTDRAALEQEGLLLKVTTPYREHHLFVELAE